MSLLKSTAKQIKPLNYNEKIVITELRADQNIVEQHKARLKQMFPNDKEQDLERKITEIVARDNVFAAIMNIIVPSFSFDIKKEDTDRVITDLKKLYKDVDEKNLNMIAENVIKRDAMFVELAKLWDIFVTDEEVKEALNGYYKVTNEPIRDFLSDQQKFDNIRNLMLADKISKEMFGRFNYRIELKKPEAKKEEPKPA
ncbi:MAG: hypothetical protein L3I91_00735 [Mycoplasma sp.]